MKSVLLAYGLSFSFFFRELLVAELFLRFFTGAAGAGWGTVGDSEPERINLEEEGRLRRGRGDRWRCCCFFGSRLGCPVAFE